MQITLFNSVESKGVDDMHDETNIGKFRTTSGWKGTYVHHNHWTAGAELHRGQCRPMPAIDFGLNTGNSSVPALDQKEKKKKKCACR
ncbi:Hypothetical predicted protein [Olea europaea subsp. europaea]|uniref:Uncharacterized protein n=1 Tax=Olea europaea subsp. europaea TaxID=158383 RepID=A0A8S0RXQ4_OLEEU|nr:Hypothetical predicted protein [Olea europaea subsp. europaea]